MPPSSFLPWCCLPLLAPIFPNSKVLFALTTTVPSLLLIVDISNPIWFGRTSLPSSASARTLEAASREIKICTPDKPSRMLRNKGRTLVGILAAFSGTVCVPLEPLSLGPSFPLSPHTPSEAPQVYCFLRSSSRFIEFLDAFSDNFNLCNHGSTVTSGDWN